MSTDRQATRRRNLRGFFQAAAAVERSISKRITWAPSRGEEPGRGQPDPAAAAGDDGNLIGQAVSWSLSGHGTP